MADYILRQPVMQSDETPVRMQLADGQMETARLWAYGLPWAEVVFDLEIHYLKRVTDGCCNNRTTQEF